MDLVLFSSKKKSIHHERFNTISDKNFRPKVHRSCAPFPPPRDVEKKHMEHLLSELFCNIFKLGNGTTCCPEVELR